MLLLPTNAQQLGDVALGVGANAVLIDMGEYNGAIVADFHDSSLFAWGKCDTHSSSVCGSNIGASPPPAAVANGSPTNGYTFDVVSVRAIPQGLLLMKKDGRVMIAGLASNYVFGFSSSSVFTTSSNEYLDARVPKDRRGDAIFATISSVSSKSGSVCGIYRTGEITCWGSRTTNGENIVGLLGAYSTPGYIIAVGNKTLVQAATHTSFTCVLTFDGVVACGGTNTNNELGRTSAGGTHVMGVVALPARAVAINAGPNAAGAILEDGRLVLWGGTSDCATGTSNCAGTCSSSSPFVVPFTGSAANNQTLAFCLGEWFGCLVYADGRGACWGRGEFNAVRSTDVKCPSVVSVSGCSRCFVAVACGPNAGCFLGSNGRMYCFGSGGNFLTAIGTSSALFTPTVAPTLSPNLLYGGPMPMRHTQWPAVLKVGLLETTGTVAKLQLTVLYDRQWPVHSVTAFVETTPCLSTARVIDVDAKLYLNVTDGLHSLWLCTINSTVLTTVTRWPAAVTISFTGSPGGLLYATYVHLHPKHLAVSAALVAGSLVHPAGAVLPFHVAVNCSSRITAAAAFSLPTCLLAFSFTLSPTFGSSSNVSRCVWDVRGTAFGIICDVGAGTAGAFAVSLAGEVDGSQNGTVRTFSMVNYSASVTMSLACIPACNFEQLYIGDTLRAVATSAFPYPPRQFSFRAMADNATEALSCHVTALSGNHFDCSITESFFLEVIATGRTRRWVTVDHGLLQLQPQSVAFAAMPAIKNLTRSWCFHSSVDPVNVTIHLSHIFAPVRNYHAVQIGGANCSNLVQVSTAAIQCQLVCSATQKANSTVAVHTRGFGWSSAALWDIDSPLQPTIGEIIPFAVVPAGNITIRGVEWMSRCGETPDITEVGVYNTSADGTPLTASPIPCRAFVEIRVGGRFLQCALPAATTSVVVAYIRMDGLLEPVISSMPVYFINRITSVRPTWCVRDATTPVVVTIVVDQVFQPLAVHHAVRVGGAPCSSLNMLNSTTLRCEIACSETRYGNTSVMVFTRGIGWERADVWDVESPLAPSITDVWPLVTQLHGNITIFGTQWQTRCNEGPGVQDVGVYAMGSDGNTNFSAKFPCTAREVLGIPHDTIICALPSLAGGSVVPYVHFAGLPSPVVYGRVVSVLPAAIISVTPTWCLRAANAPVEFAIQLSTLVTQRAADYSVWVGGAVCSSVSLVNATTLLCTALCLQMQVGNASVVVLARGFAASQRDLWDSTNTLSPVISAAFPSTVNPSATVSFFGAGWSNFRSDGPAIIGAGIFRSNIDGSINLGDYLPCSSFTYQRTVGHVVQCALPADAGTKAYPYVQFHGLPTPVIGAVAVQIVQPAELFVDWAAETLLSNRTGVSVLPSSIENLVPVPAVRLNVSSASSTGTFQCFLSISGSQHTLIGPGAGGLTSAVYGESISFDAVGVRGPHMSFVSISVSCFRQQLNTSYVARDVLVAYVLAPRFRWLVQPPAAILPSGVFTSAGIEGTVDANRLSFVERFDGLGAFAAPLLQLYALDHRMTVLDLGDVQPASFQVIAVAVATPSLQTSRNLLVGVLPSNLQDSLLQLNASGVMYTADRLHLQASGRWLDGSLLAPVSTQEFYISKPQVLVHQAPTRYFYGILTEVFVYELRFSPTPTSTTSLVAEDIRCELRVETVLFRNVLYRSEDDSVATFDPTTMLVTVPGLNLRPTVSGPRADVSASVVLLCKFRGMQIDAATSLISMVNASLAVWPQTLALVPSSRTTVKPSDTAVVIQLLDDNGFPLPPSALDYTCTMGIRRTYDSKGNELSTSAQLQYSGSTLASSNASVMWSHFSIQGPPGGMADVGLLCESALGGVALASTISLRLFDVVPVWTSGTSIMQGAPSTITWPPSVSALTSRTGAGNATLAVDTLYGEPVQMTASYAMFTAHSNECLFGCTGGPAFDECTLLPGAAIPVVSNHSVYSIPESFVGELAPEAAAEATSMVLNTVTRSVDLTVTCSALPGWLCAVQLRCSIGPFWVVSPPIYMSVRNVTVTLRNESGLVVVPSSRSLLRPFGALHVHVDVDKYPLRVHSSLSTRCVLSTSFISRFTEAVEGDLAPDNSEIVAFPSTTVVDAGATGSVRFRDVGLIAPQGVTLRVTVTCQRALSGPAYSSSIVISVYSSTVDWCNKSSITPLPVYHRVPVPLQVCVKSVQPLNASVVAVEWDSQRLGAVQCALEIESSNYPGEIALLGGANAMSAFLDDRGRAGLSMILALTAEDSVASVGASCIVLDVQKRAAPLQIRRALLTLTWLKAPSTVIYPSSALRLLAMQPVPVVRVREDDGLSLAGPIHAGLVCQTAASYIFTPVQTSVARMLEPPVDGYVVDMRDSTVTINRAFLSAAWNSTVMFNVTCTRPQGDRVAPLVAYIRIPSPVLRLHDSYTPFTSISANALLAVRAVIIDTHSGSILHLPVDVPDDQTLDCSLTVDPSPFAISGNTARTRNGTFEISGLQISAFRGANLTAIVSCSIGSLVVPNELRWNFTVSGCMEGEGPNLEVGGSICSVCPDNFHSRGGSAPCTPCPTAGVVCTKGRVIMARHYYLASSPIQTSSVTYELLHALPPGVTNAVRIVAFDKSVEFHACFNTRACYMNDTSRTYGCNAGYTGVLCGVCDISNRYTKLGTGCAPCLDRAFNIFLIFVGVVFVLAVLVYISLYMTSSDTLSRPLWRMMVNYVSSLASLGIYAARGTDTWRRFISYANSLMVPGAGTTLNISPVACEMPLTFHSRYYLTLSTPFLLAVVCSFINLVYIVVGKCRGVVDPSVNIVSVTKSKALSVSMLVIFLMYPSMTSQALRAFKCSASAIGGTRYLLDDLAVDCDSSAHRVAITIAWATVLLFCLGIPAAFAWLLYRNSGHIAKRGTISQLSPTELAFERSFSFLYHGYKTEHLSCYAYECVIMVRKAMIILIGSVSVDAVYESIGAILLVMTSLVVHMYTQPFAFPLFNHLETAALLALGVTQAVSLLYLRAGQALEPTKGALLSVDGSIDVSDVSTLPPGFLGDVFTTAILLLVNLCVLSIMVYFWFVLRRAEIPKESKIKALQQRFTQPKTSALRRCCRLLCCIGQPITIQAKHRAMTARELAKTYRSPIYTPAQGVKGPLSSTRRSSLSRLNGIAVHHKTTSLNKLMPSRPDRRVVLPPGCDDPEMHIQQRNPMAGHQVAGQADYNARPLKRFAPVATRAPST